MKKSKITYYGIVIFLLFSVSFVRAATRYSVAIGNWNSTSTWSATSGGASGASVPVAGDAVTIERAHNVTVTVGAACTSINFTTVNATSLTINSGITLNVSGVITIPRSGSGVNLIAVGAGVLNAGSVAFTSGGGPVRHKITISTGTLTVSGDITTDNTGASATITFTGAGTLNAGVGILTTTTVGGTLTTFAGSTVNYNGAAQTVKNVNYTGNLTLSGSGTKTLGTSTATIGGNLTLSGIATTTTVVGLTISGNLVIGNGTTLTTAGFNLTVAGTTTVGGGTSGNLTVSSTAGTKRFTGLVTINAGATWSNSSNSTINFRGGITNNGGTFTCGTGVQTFNTSSQSLNGTLSIPKVTVTGVTLTNNGTLTVTTALAGTGGLTNAATGTLNINFPAAVGISTLTATASGNMVNYGFLVAQTVKGTTYSNLTLSGSGAKTTTGATVNGILSMEGTATTTGTIPTYGAAATLQYKGSVAQTTGIEFPSAWNGSGGVVINNSAGVSLNSSTTINVPLTLTSGEFSLGANTFTLNGEIFVTSGTLTGGVNTNIVCSGSSSSILPAVSLNNLTINRASGISLGGNVSVNGTLLLTSGLLSTGSYTISFTTTATDPVETTGSRIVGNAVMLSRPVNAGELNFLGFDIATGVDDIGNVSFTRVTGDNGIITAANNNSGIACYWDITVGTQPATNGRTVTFSWLSDLDNTHDFVSNKGELWKSTDGSPSSWNHVCTADVGIPHTITTLTKSFSWWTVSTENNPLPVDLFSFNAKCVNDKIMLDWITASETNNDYFTIEKSNDLQIWNVVTTVNGAGNSNNYVYYSAQDDEPYSGNLYYRLKQTDFNGIYKYSDVIVANCEPEQQPFDLVSVITGQQENEIILTFTAADREQFNYALYDYKGGLLQKVSGKAVAGINEVHIKSDNFCKGIYITVLQNIEKSVGQKILLK